MLTRSALKYFYSQVQVWLGMDHRQLRRLQRRQRVAVVNLHRVSPVTNPFWPHLSPHLFDDLVGYLAKHCHVTTFGRLCDTPADKPTVVLSFDDGYYDFLDYAAPILAKHGVRANQNVIGICARSGQPPWNVDLYDFLNAAPVRLLEHLTLPGLEARLKSDSPTAKTHFGLQISRFLKNRPRLERLELWEILAAQMQQAPDYPRTRMMTTVELREAAKIHEIGSHSFSHESMGFETMEFFADDLKASKAFFAHELELPLDIYAFPNGSHRQEQIRHLQEAGVRHTLLVDEGLTSATSHVHPRLTLYGDSAQELYLRSLGVFSKDKR